MLESNLDNLMNLAESIYLDSLKLFYDSSETVEEYINTDELTLEEKITDIEDMLSFAEARELYEYCTMLKTIKGRLNG